MKPEEAIEIVQAIKFIDDFDDYSDRLEIALDMAIEALNRPHGEWVKFTLEGGFLSSHKCSNCGFHGNQLWHFCPNCGADMRKEGDPDG